MAGKRRAEEVFGEGGGFRKVKKTGGGRKRRPRRVSEFTLFKRRLRLKVKDLRKQKRDCDRALRLSINDLARVRAK